MADIAKIKNNPPDSKLIICYKWKNKIEDVPLNEKIRSNSAQMQDALGTRLPESTPADWDDRKLIIIFLR